METILVFISSTSDLGEERAAVAEALKFPFTPYRYEHDHGRGKSPRDRLVEILDKTDLYVGILGARYGALYPDAGQDRAIVEWEFDEASARRRIELFSYHKAVEERAIEPDQKRFLEKVAHFLRGRWAPPFKKTNDLVTRLLADLAQFGGELLLAQREQEVAEEGEDGPFAERLLRALPAGDERYAELERLARRARQSAAEEPGDLVDRVRKVLADADDPVLRRLAREAEELAAARSERRGFLGRLRGLAIAALGSLAVAAVVQLTAGIFSTLQLLLFAGLIVVVIGGCVVVSRL